MLNQVNNDAIMAQKDTDSTRISQFELINLVYKSKLFQKMDLKPTAKLVLYALIHHYNPCNEDMFPSQKFIAQSLGISDKSVERAIKELAASRLIMYITKNVNRYKFTATFFESVKMSDTNRQNVGLTNRQNVGQTYKHEQKKNNSVSSFSRFRDQKSSAAHYKTVQETKIMLEEFEANKKIEFSPKDFSKVDARKWLDTLPAALHGGILAQEVYKKYGFAMDEKVKQALILRNKLPKMFQNS